MQLLYSILKFFIRLARPTIFRKIIINRPELLKEKGPLLLACNHPNSFLDAIILDMLFQNPVWSLARGDVFINSFVRKILTGLKMLPVYRTREGVENILKNYKTFDACVELFKENGIVTIFSEGRCINEWHLRPLMKGTARLALKSWGNNIPLKVLPVGFNYSSFRRFGKNVVINFGEIITQESIDESQSEGLRIQSFNNQLQLQLQKLVYEIKQTNRALIKQQMKISLSSSSKIVLAIPAAVGWLLHAPFYFPLKKVTLKYFRRSDHYDSVLAALLLFTYPIYLTIITVLLFYFTQNSWLLSTFIWMPATAICLTQLKGQLDK